MRRGLRGLDRSDLEILPGKGLGPLRFGMSIEETQAVLGPPVKTLAEEDDMDSRMLLYEGLALSFPVEEWRLDTIEVDRELSPRLFGVEVFSLGREGVIELLRRHLKPSDLEGLTETRDEDLEEIAIRAGTVCLTFYFDLEDVLHEVQWGPFWDLDADEVIWPQPEG